jgi:glucose-1-phosphate thymidylyltransferase
VNALILAAGYATRLYPLTKDFPKPLLEVGGRAILDHLVDQLEGLATLARIVVVTNHRFAPRFEEWRKTRAAARPLEVLDDGTICNENRLGAVGDLRFALAQARLNDDLLVAAGDNIFQFPLAGFVEAFRARPAAHLCVHWVEDLARCRRTGIAVLGEDDRVIEFQEKPEQPKSRWGVPPLYVFPRATLQKLASYAEEGGSNETPGYFMAWLHRREPVYAFRAPGAVLDIGTLESLQAARQLMEAAERGGQPYKPRTFRRA